MNCSDNNLLTNTESIVASCESIVASCESIVASCESIVTDKWDKICKYKLIILLVCRYIDLSTYLVIIRCAKWIYRLLSIDKYAYIRTYNVGTAIVKVRYIGNKPDGFHRRWYTDGTLNKQCYYYKGKLHGLYQKWYKTGILDLKCMYIDGVRNGIYEGRYISGKLYTRRYYLNGKLNGPYYEATCNGLHDQYSSRYRIDCDGFQYEIDCCCYKKCTYKNDKLEGIYASYTCGKIDLLYYYVNGYIWKTYIDS